MRQTNKEYFTGLKQAYINGSIDRDDVLDDIEREYCDGLIFEDTYDKLDYMVKLIKTWDIFNEKDLYNT